MSVEQYQALLSAQDRPGHDARRQAFEAEFSDWIAAENARVEGHGVPGADLRPW
jgi:hypothetical protein